MVPGTFDNPLIAFVRAGTYRDTEPNQWVTDDVVGIVRGKIHGCMDMLGMGNIQIPSRYLDLAVE
jgi:hypothetical protein